MANLSLNGYFKYPVDLKQTLSVDGQATFNSNIVVGSGNAESAEKNSITAGEACAANSRNSMALGESTVIGAGTPNSFAAGYGCGCSMGEDSGVEGYVGHSVAMGLGAHALHPGSFVWQGDMKGPYNSKGPGTFSINPSGNDVLSAVFIGDHSLSWHISSVAKETILENANEFTEPQSFLKGIEAGGISELNAVNFAGSVNLNGDAKIDGANDNTGANFDRNVASHAYANMAATSAVTNVGDYYGDGKSPGDSYAVSYGVLKSYATSSVRNPEDFYEKGIGEPPRSYVSTRGYVVYCVDSLYGKITTGTNVFSGKNTFGADGGSPTTFNGPVHFRGGSYVHSPGLTAESGSTVDLSMAGVRVVGRAWGKSDDNSTPATLSYAYKSYENAVGDILNKDNTYLKNIVLGGPSSQASAASTVTLSGKRDVRTSGNYIGTIDLRNGSPTILITEPLSGSSAYGVPSTVGFSRTMAASAVDFVLKNGCTFRPGSEVFFDGNVAFNSKVDLRNDKAELYVKTKALGGDNGYAASTGYVGNAITKSLETSSESVWNLVLGSQFPNKDSYNTYTNRNRFKGVTDFTTGTVVVSTMPDDTSDNHAASCEFVKNLIADLYSTFLFEMRVADYDIKKDGWYESGSVVSETEAPMAVNHILDDLVNAEITYDIIGTNQVNFYRASDGHKIVIGEGSNFDYGGSSFSPMNEGDKIGNAYRLTGQSWYYILTCQSSSDGSRTFSLTLPKASRFVFHEGDSENPGDFVPAQLPEHTHIVNAKLGSSGSYGSDFNAHNGGNTVSVQNPDWTTTTGIYPMAGGGSGAVLEISEDTNVRPPATKAYLYMYCGPKGI